MESVTNEEIHLLFCLENDLIVIETGSSKTLFNWAIDLFKN